MEKNNQRVSINDQEKILQKNERINSVFCESVTAKYHKFWQMIATKKNKKRMAIGHRKNCQFCQMIAGDSREKANFAKDCGAEINLKILWKDHKKHWC